MKPVIIDGLSLAGGGENISLEQVERFFGLFSCFYVPAANVVFPPVPYRFRFFVIMRRISDEVKKRLIKGKSSLWKLQALYGREPERGLHS